MVAPSEDPIGVELLSVIARLNRWATYRAEFDTPPAKARLLAQIESLGPARVGDLARADHCSQPTMSTQLQRLEEDGWVTRVTDPADARAVVTSLTPEGRAVLADVRRSRAAVVAPLVEQMTPAQRKRLRAAVAALSEVVELAQATGRREDPILEEGS